MRSEDPLTTSIRSVSVAALAQTTSDGRTYDDDMMGAYLEGFVQVFRTVGQPQHLISPTLAYKQECPRGLSYEADFKPRTRFEQIAGMAWNPKLSDLDLIAGIALLQKAFHADTATSVTIPCQF